MESIRIPLHRRGTVLALMGAALAFALLLAIAPAARAAAIPSDGASRQMSETVQPGDSWSVLRGRMFPTEALMSANPGLTRKGLNPGDVVRAPFVPVSRVDAALKRLSETESKLREATGANAALEQRVAATADLEKALADERSSSAALKFTTFALTTAALVLGGALAGALLFLRLARREAHLAERGLKRTEVRYGELRKELRGVEIDLQRRMVNLLHLHDVRVVSEEEVDDALAPLVKLATLLKKKHAG
ncbi:MAG: hypothetical protein Q8R92_07450 [Deltaproteobacteria bacterium]|nr:hypothetical protein [Deltaproteobacteria bacterium]